MVFYPVDETGTPIFGIGAGSSQHSYLFQSRNPLRAVQDALNEQMFGDPYAPNSATKALQGSLGLDILNDQGSGYYGGGSGGSAPGRSPYVVRNGRVEFADPNMNLALQLLHQETDRANAWSAQQALKQMEFQERMSSTAHQREVEDLKAAGLNPVLSAGGAGAQAMSGSSPDSSQASINGVLELAMGALGAISQTAVGVASATSRDSDGSFWNNSFVKKAISAGASALGSGVVRKLLTRSPFG